MDPRGDTEIDILHDLATTTLYLETEFATLVFIEARFDNSN